MVQINTGILVKKDEIVEITASGEIFNGLVTFSPDGGYAPPTYGTTILPDISSNSLVGSINDFSTGDLLDDGTDINPAGISGEEVGYPGLFGPGYLGSRFIGVVQSDGNIYLAFNDYPLSDNTGSFEIRITVFSTYVISGKVTDLSGKPHQGVAISAGINLGLGTGTNENGEYELLIPEGTFSVWPYKEGYDFSPNQIDVTVPSENQIEYNFIGANWGGRPTPFLDLPFDYGDSIFGFLLAMSNSKAGGRINAWFDHKYPNYKDDDGSGIWLYNKIYDDEEDKQKHKITEKSYIYSYNSIFYDGHDGIDFSYKDPDLGDDKLDTQLDIYPAASGKVIDECHTCTTGFGNYVILYHEVDVGNGYFTRYAHLAEVDPEVIIKKGSHEIVSMDETLGTMGSTGSSSGPHLHFGVYRDNGDGEWNSNHDKKVDPFEYRLNTVDPWVEDNLGPVSYNLWKNIPTNQASFSGNSGAIVADRSDRISVTIPPNYFIGESVVELSPEPAPRPQFSLRSLGLSFWLRILQGLSIDAFTTTIAATSQIQVDADPLGLSVNYSDDQVQHLVESDLALYQWNDVDKFWDQLPSQVDVEGNVVSGSSLSVGVFDLQAPLTCPEDIQEPNDKYSLAHELNINGGGTKQLFDIQADEDWFIVQANSGWKYTLQTLNLAPSVDTKLDVYNKDLSILYQDNDSGDGEGASKLTWYASTSGIYYIRVSQDTGSTNGCSASYNISVLGDGRIYIPLVSR